MRTKTKAAASLTIICLLLGFIISVQYHTNAAAFSDLSLQSNSDLVVILGEMNRQRANLASQERDLREELTILSEASTSESSAIDTLKEEYAILTAATGTVDVQGPGINLNIPSQKKLIANDLVLILNELWNAGAEAIAVNNIRITTASGFTTAGTGSGVKIKLNNTTLTFPLTIQAIGDSKALSAALSFPGGVMANLATEMELVYDTTEMVELNLPAAL